MKILFVVAWAGPAFPASLHAEDALSFKLVKGKHPQYSVLVVIRNISQRPLYFRGYVGGYPWIDRVLETWNGDNWESKVYPICGLGRGIIVIEPGTKKVLELHFLRSDRIYRVRVSYALKNNMAELQDAVSEPLDIR